MEPISEHQFLSVAIEEHCAACLDERQFAVSPTYMHYRLRAQDMIRRKTFPTWRVSTDGTSFIGAFEVPKQQAHSISFDDLSKASHLFGAIDFDATRDYFRSNRIIAFHCSSCGVHVVKDGNHRLLQCAVHMLDPDLEVYEVISGDWLRCQVDMKNFCECISTHALQSRPILI